MDYLIPAIGLTIIIIGFAIAFRSRRKPETKWDYGKDGIPF
jgi:hypothetical protein